MVSRRRSFSKGSLHRNVSQCQDPHSKLNGHEVGRRREVYAPRYRAEWPAKPWCPLRCAAKIQMFSLSQIVNFSLLLDNARNAGN